MNRNSGKVFAYGSKLNRISFSVRRFGNEIQKLNINIIFPRYGITSEVANTS
uniref:Uncharacterized protein n=1 Tax=Tetranychus urticae TaxID=32264 RepID=T1KLU8_TETUR